MAFEFSDERIHYNKRLIEVVLEQSFIMNSQIYLFTSLRYVYPVYSLD